jgi:hypothetical protein
MMKNMIAVCLGIFVVSCAHERAVVEPMVHFSYAPDLLETIQKSPLRKPASALTATEEKSPRRAYFSSLYHQSLVIGQFLKKDSRREFCPQFHHDKIATEGYYVPHMVAYPKSQVEAEGKEFFPELAFNKNFSLKQYYTQIESELDTLCEEGLSDNYYKFDNLVTHHATNPSFHANPKAMESVLKIPVFANLYLIRMLQGDAQVAVTSPEEQLLIKLTQTHWFDRYLTEASRLRPTFIKNKLVRR